MNNILNKEMYEIKIIPKAQKDLDKFRGKIFDNIKKSIFDFKINPRPPNCQKLSTQEGYRIRKGKVRILYRIDNENKLIIIYRIKLRKDVYK